MTTRRQMHGLGDFGSDLIDLFSGGPAKRARQARDARRAAEAAARAQIEGYRTQTELARIEAEKQAALIRTVAFAGLAGLGAYLLIAR